MSNSLDNHANGSRGILGHHWISDSRRHLKRRRYKSSFKALKDEQTIWAERYQAIPLLGPWKFPLASPSFRFVIVLFCFVFIFWLFFFLVLKCLDSVRAQKLSLLRISIIKRKTCQPQIWMSSKKIKRDLTVCNLKLLKTSVSSSMVYWKTKRYAMITHKIMIKNQEKLCKNPSVLTWLRTINPSRFALVFRAQSWQ